jgi:hypothetical protein
MVLPMVLPKLRGESCGLFGTIRHPSFPLLVSARLHMIVCD